MDSLEEAVELTPAHPFHAYLARLTPPLRMVNQNDIDTAGAEPIKVSCISPLNIEMVERPTFGIFDQNLFVAGRTLRLAWPASAPPEYRRLRPRGTGIADDGTTAPYVIGLDRCRCTEHTFGLWYFNPLCVAVIWQEVLATQEGARMLTDAWKQCLIDNYDSWCPSGLATLLWQLGL